MRPIVFDTLASALRISTKYYIQFLRDWAIAQMRTTWPSNLDQMVPMALPHAAGMSPFPPTFIHIIPSFASALSQTRLYCIASRHLSPQHPACLHLRIISAEMEG